MPQPGSRAAARPKSPHHRQLSGVTTSPRISRSGPSGSVTAVQKTAAAVTGLCGPGSPAATRAATSASGGPVTTGVSAAGLADVDHPVDTEPIGAHAELVAPHLLLQRDRHGA